MGKKRVGTIQKSLSEQKHVTKEDDKQKEVTIDFGSVSEKQRKFLEAKTPFVCFGGARGGGKSYIVRIKAVGMCFRYPGIRILALRCHYPELEENLVRPTLKFVPQELYSYNATSHLMTFYNGSIIKFGHYDGDRAENEYQGTQYDVLFIDEATQFSERAFLYLKTVVRGENEAFPKRIYLTCNPGGVGHRWVKRLFVDKDYKRSKNPEEDENPRDYTMIFAKLEDNPWLLKSTPMYAQALASLPPDLRKAHRYGDWDALGGSYFKEFKRGVNTCNRFQIPPNWTRYRSFDYGLDLLACLWFAVDADGRAWCYREVEKSDLSVRDAARLIKSNTLPSEKILVTYAPPDVWNRQKDSGKSMAEIYTLQGVPVVKSNNNRVQGHMIMKDMMAPIPLRDPYILSLFPKGKAPERLPALMFFNDLDRAIGDIRDIQADTTNPNDCAKQPHDVTHVVDACRYFCVNRALKAGSNDEDEKREDDDYLFEELEDYESYMVGGEITEAYIRC